MRVKYTPTTGDLAMRTRFGFWDDPWAIDAPAAEQNLSRRVQTATAIEVGEPLVLALDDPRLWQYPWLYLVEPSNARAQRRPRRRRCASSCCAAARSPSTTSTARSSGS